LVIPDIENPHVSTLIQKTQNYAHQSGYSVILSITNNDVELEKKYIETLLHKGVDGVIVNHTVDTRGKKYLQELVDEGIPIVLLGRIEGLEIDSLLSDIEKGVYLLIEHLIKLGHKRIVFLKGHTTQYRVTGYKSALDKYNIPVDENLIIEHGQKLEDLPGIVDRILLINPRPTAVFGFNDYLAIGLVTLLEERGIRVPDDMAVVGLDNINLSKYARVPLTTVDLKPDLVAKGSIDLIINKITNGKNNGYKFQSITIEPEMIIRQSCGRLIKSI